MFTIRSAKAEDAERLLEIYSYYVENTAISFEYETPSLDEFKNRIINTIKDYPYLVIEENGNIQGYAYAGPLIKRPAYIHSCETTIYLDQNATKRGMGRALYEELEKSLREIGILNMYACIAYPNGEDEYLTTNSADFHKHIGFTTAGRFCKCGYKFNRWYDIIWMERLIGEHL